MILSNEPGYYREGAFGIRIENLVAVEPREIPGAERDMLGFETLTLAPIDLRLIEPKCSDARGKSLAQRLSRQSPRRFVAPSGRQGTRMAEAGDRADMTERLENTALATILFDAPNICAGACGVANDLACRIS